MKGREICRKLKLKRPADEISAQISIMKRNTCRNISSLSPPDEIPAQIQNKEICRNLKIGSTAEGSSAQIAIIKKSQCRKLKIRSSLREDIIAMILSRLPVKSIFRFRCVSKSWCSLLSSKYFIESHLQISIKNTNFANNIIIIEKLYRYTSLSTLKFFPLDVVLYTSCSYEGNFDYTFPSIPSSMGFIVLMGCCNGICCALITGKTGKSFLLWNPSIRKSTMKFPKMERHSSCTLCGFGFNEIFDEYKAVVGSVTAVQCETIVYLYSFKSNSRKMVDFPIKGMGHAFVDIHGVFANGKLHWLVIHDYDKDVTNLGFDIVCFDLGTELYGGVLEKPFYLNKRSYPSIGVLSGCLCVVFGTREHLHEIWVLKKDGIKEYWDKVMTIPYLFFLRIVGPKPLCITPEGVIMFLMGEAIYMYDPKNDNAPRIINYASLSQFSVCVQSLVFPFCDGEEENQKHWYQRLIGEDVMDKYTVTIQDLKSRLGEETQSDTCPSSGSPAQQSRSSKRQRRSPMWMKDYMWTSD